MSDIRKALEALADAAIRQAWFLGVSEIAEGDALKSDQRTDFLKALDAALAQPQAAQPVPPDILATLRAALRDGNFNATTIEPAALNKAADWVLATPPTEPQAAQPADTLELDLLRTDFKRECDDTDSILRMLGLDPENCRTDGGSLKCTMILDALEARDRMIRRLAVAATPPAEPAPQAEPSRSQKMREAGFTPRDTRMTCDECGAKFTRQFAPLHECAEPKP